MVFYFVTTLVSPPMVIYMGEDKFENEELLKYGFPCDIWFHVDDLSSAHVYLRVEDGTAIENIPRDVILDCAHLVKHNSIKGCKLSKVKVVYTPFSNLMKTARMDTGQVGFVDQHKVLSIEVGKNNEAVKRLEKTQKQRKPDLRAEKEEWDAQERQKKRQRDLEERKQKKTAAEQKQKEDELKSYKSLMQEGNMKTNKFDEQVDYRNFEDDFM